MNGELLAILESIEREKGIDREILIRAVETALASAAKKAVPGKEQEPEQVEVKIDRQSGKISIVADGKEVPSGEFGRIAAQTAKQVIIQKIREAERDVIFNEFQGKMGDIVTGFVHRFDKGSIIVDLGRTEAILPKSERVPHEEYKQGDRIQAYVLEVQKSPKGPQIVLSRVHIGLVKGLFEREVPEIFEGIVEIKSFAREPGDRAKIAVTSKDEKVDCLGACVGMRGTRVKNIVRELNGEKIDIVRWNEDPQVFIAEALSPAKVAETKLDRAAKRALVIVEDDQLSLAIGKRGQNVRLASKLTGWNLDIKSKSELKIEALPPISELPGVGPAMDARLKEAGFGTVDAIARATVETLTQVKGVGEKTAEKLLETARGLMPAATPRPMLTLPEVEAATPAESTEPPADTPAEPAAEEPAAQPEPEPGPEPEAETASPQEPTAEDAPTEPQKDNTDDGDQKA
ncbi:MAG: transcription termination/antitermination protein NusA [Candidatus Omnitrophica bacterium]|nr:transcription termination/antitermination protein NusA [Candidatus Omnitrophota bacterium]